MAQVGKHVAPGITGFMPGWFVEPMNPITAAVRQAQGVGYVPRIGQFMAARFAEPENPILNAISGPPGSGMPQTQSRGSAALSVSTSLAGLGCSCGGMMGAGSCGCSGAGMGVGGLGDLSSSLSSLTSTLGTAWTSLTSYQVAGIPVVYLAAGGLMLFLFMGRSSADQSGYRRDLAALRSKYPTYARRARRAVGAF